jgi:bifunctional enzyme CysN/CysC
MRNEKNDGVANAAFDSSDRPILHVLTCGSVDDGKSTLLGRLLYDVGALPEDALETLRRDSKSLGKAGHKFDFSLLFDGLQAEREQGITIDVAYRYFASARRKFIIADSPGHEQYTRNMVTGASGADLAVILIDVRKGLVVQTKRHACIVHLLGIRHVIVAVNKMDLVGYDENRFEAISRDFKEFATSLGIPDVAIVPVAAVDGDNVAAPSMAMTWYSGKTLLALLEASIVSTKSDAQPLRLPVQWVCRPHLDFRGYAGTLTCGRVAPGDPIVVLPSGLRSRVGRVMMAHSDDGEAVSGDAVMMTLTDDIDVGRGDVICAASDPIDIADKFCAKIVWLGEQPMQRGRSYIWRCGPQTAVAQIGACKHKVDVNDLKQVPGGSLGLNEIGLCEFSLDRQVAFQPYNLSRENGGFILIDRMTNETVGAGMIDFALRRSLTVHWQAVDVDKKARARINSHRPCCLWFTGLSGAGKSTIANALERRLHAKGVHTYLLDGDNIRHGLCRDLGFTEADRVENIRRVSEVARLMTDAGLVTLVSLISPFESDRRSARELFPAGEFLEVFVDTSLGVCEARDPKGLYGKARKGQIRNFTGVDQIYEAPQFPEMRFDTSVRSAEDIVDLMIADLSYRGIIGRADVNSDPECA